MLELRRYQADAVDRLRARYQGGARKIVLVSPTGSGKTVIAGHLIQRTLERGNRILFVAHRWELLDQPRRLLEACGLRVGLIKSGHDEDREASVQVASIQTLINRPLPPADLVIVDECHRGVTKSYRCLEQYPYHLGLTATPWRLDGQGLGGWYEEMLQVAQPSELIADGWLLQPRVFAPHVPKMGAALGNGDYTMGQLQSVMDHSELVGDIVEHWQRLANGRPTVCFASGIQHSLHICDRFRTASITAQHVDSNTQIHDRAASLRALADGSCQVLCNVDIVTEGYDLPRLSCAILARPTMSATKYLQMVGRIQRPDDHKRDCIVLDHAGCSVRHGFPADDREWSLDGRENRRARAGLRVCSYCFAVNVAAARRCDACGEAFPVTEQPRKLKRERRGELREMAANERGKHTSPTQKSLAFKQLKLIGENKGYAKGWATIQFKLRYGHWPVR